MCLKYRQIKYLQAEIKVKYMGLNLREAVYHAQDFTTTKGTQYRPGPPIA